MEAGANQAATVVPGGHAAALTAVTDDILGTLECRNPVGRLDECASDRKGKLAIRTSSRSPIH